MLFWNGFRLNLDLERKKTQTERLSGCNLAGAGNVKSFVQSHCRLYDEEQTQLTAYRRDSSKLIMSTGKEELAETGYFSLDVKLNYSFYYYYCHKQKSAAVGQIVSSSSINAKCFPILFVGMCESQEQISEV